MKLLTRLFILFSISIISCSESKVYRKPPATGKIGDLLIVIDRMYWDSEVGDTIRSIFARPYPMLPQDEKTFNLLSIPYSAFNPSLQRLRNMVITNVSEEYTEAKILTQSDIWATPQIVVNVVGPSAHDISLILSEKRELLLDLFEQAERNRQSENASKYEDINIRETIENKFGVRMYIPSGYQILSNQKDFMWLENRTTHINYGIFIYTYPYTDNKTFTVDYLINKRDEYLKKYVPGQRDSSWMVTSKYLKPKLELKKYKNVVYGEMRGLWEVENDYMGGPFINRSYVDTTKARIITVEAYVYAPKFDKRDHLRRVDGVINTLELYPENNGEIIYNKLNNKGH